MRFETTHDTWWPDITGLQKTYTTIAKPTKPHNADPILLACVRDHKKNGDPNVEIVIVTHDMDLQNVCEREGISSIDIPELLRRELGSRRQGQLPLNNT